MTQLRISFLGQIQIHQGEKPVSHFATNKVEALFAYLVMESNRPFSRSMLSTLLWPDMPEADARHNLRQTLFRLRQAIPAPPDKPPYFLIDRQTIQFNPECNFWLDAAEFEQLQTTCQQHKHQYLETCSQCMERLETAVSLYRGDFLSQFYVKDSVPFEAWALAKREWLRRKALDALSLLSAYNDKHGRYEIAQRHAQRQIEIDPLREEGYQQLMRVLAKNQRRSEAITVYYQCEQILLQELNLPPAPQTTALYEKILTNAQEVIPEKPGVIRGYDCREEIGAGAFGVVYRAVHPLVEREVAVKVIRAQYANNPNFIRRFEAEARTIARLEHPFIVPLYDYWREPDSAVLVMRYLRGGSLRASLQQESWEMAAICKLIEQIAAALSVAHQQGVVHRDIKPENILLDENGNSYLADFGIAKDQFDKASSFTHMPISSSLAYSSPELAKDQPVTPLSDQYSLGIVVYELLVGQLPLTALSEKAESNNFQAGPLPPLQNYRPQLHKTINDVVQRAIANDAQARFPDILSFAKAFIQTVNRNSLIDAPIINDFPVIERNPYKGLHPFEEADASVYFGRSTLIQHLKRRLEEPEVTDQRIEKNGRPGAPNHPFLAIIGPSGCGKSSLVKAGLLPELRRAGPPHAKNWSIVEMVPGSDPFTELANSLLKVATRRPADLIKTLRQDTDGLPAVLDQILPNQETVLLIIDQFEELFSPFIGESERLQFLANLYNAATTDNSRIFTIITLRADYYDRPLRYQGFSQLLRNHSEVVVPMTAEEIIEAISGPAATIGITVDPALVAKITADIQSQPAALPLLQYTLTELFECRTNRTMTLDSYESIGGITGALTRRAETLFQELEKADQRLTRQIFLRLISLGAGTEVTRRRVTQSELKQLRQLGNESDSGASSIIKNPLLLNPIQIFGRYRLLSFDHHPATREPTLEVAHEALLREWPRLRGWLEESREDIRQQQKIAAAAAEWRQHGKPAGFLLHGLQLAKFDEWASVSTIHLSPDESEFLQASLQARFVHEEIEAKRQARERRLEKRTRFILQTLVVVFVLATLGGFLTTAVLRNQGQQIRLERDNAQMNLTTAVAAQATSHASAATATVAQGEAILHAGLANDAAAARATAAADAYAQQLIAEVKEREAVEAYSLALVANARQVLEDNDSELAMLLALAANNIENPSPAAQRILLDAAFAPATRLLLHADQPLWGIAVSPDGRTIWAGTEDGRILVGDSVTGEFKLELTGHTAAVYEIALHPDGKQIVSASADKTLILWDTATGTPIHQFEGHTHPVSAVAFSADGQFILSGGETDLRTGFPGELIMWGVETGEMISNLEASGDLPQEGVRSVAVLPNGKAALVGVSSARGNEASFLRWDFDTGSISHIFSEIDQSVNDIALSADGRFALTASADNLVRVWDLDTGENIRTLAGHAGIVTTVAFSPDGEKCVSAGLDQTLIWWDIATGEVLQLLRGHTDAISTVRFITETSVVTSSLDGTLRIWDMTPAWQLSQWRGEGRFDVANPINTVALSPNGELLLVASGNQLILWDALRGEPIRELRGHQFDIWSVTFSPDGRRALSGGINGELFYWNVETGAAIRRLSNHKYAINSLIFSKDGNHALSAAGDEPILLWDLQSGEVVRYLHGHTDIVEVVSFLADDQLAVSGSWDASLILWNLETGEQLQRLTGLNSEIGGHFTSPDLPIIYALGILPDERLIMTASSDQSLLLWDLETGQPLRRFIGHDDYVIDVQISADGRFALSSSIDGTIIWWEIETGLPIRRFRFPGSSTQFNRNKYPPAISLAPDGETALIGLANGTLVHLRLVELAASEIIPWLHQNRYLRDFSCQERLTYQITPLCGTGLATELTTERLMENVHKMLANAIHPESSLMNAATLPIPGPILNNTHVAEVGDNLGELSPYTFDIWAYEGKANELLTIQMIADQPPSTNIPHADRLASEALDTVLILVAPDGSQLALINDGNPAPGRTPFDAVIENVRLPVSGVYRIEARSLWDVGAGGYTLRVSTRQISVAPELLESYVGEYLHQDLAGLIVTMYMEEGKLMYDAKSYGLYEMRPLGDTEFMVGIMQLSFQFTEDNNVVGYSIVGGGDAFYGERIEN